MGDGVDGQRNLRDVLARIEASRTPPELKEWLLRTVGERRPQVPTMDVSWLAALPTAMPTSLRSAGAAARLLSCSWSGGELRAQVRIEAGACCVVGRVVGPECKPVEGRSVALFVDRAPVASAVTDRHGEFEFDSRRGSTFGVRVGEGADAVHVSLVDRGVGKDDDRPPR